MRVLGIDPGLDGGLCLYDHKEKWLEALIEMPTTKGIGPEKRIIDVPAINMWLLENGGCDFATLEAVHARPGQDAGSMFRFAEGYGFVKGALLTQSVPLFFVRPSVWKAALNLSANKKLSLKRASEFFPYTDFDGHDGKAEASLLAVFGAIYYKRSGGRCA